MDAYVQTLIGPDFDTFNLLASYQRESLSKNESTFANRSGLDPSLTEQTVLDLDPGTPNLLNARTYQLPDQLLPACLQPAIVDLESVPIRQNSSRIVPTPLTDEGSAGGASAWSQYEKTTRKSNASAIKRWREKMQAVEPPVPAKSKNEFVKPARKRQRQPSSTPLSSQKGLSLEKNRVAAAKCRINRKEENERMLEDSRTLAKANKDLRDLVRTMEIEIHALATFLSAHSNSLCCKKPEEALGMLQDASLLESGRFVDLDDDLLLAGLDCPALSVSDTGRSSVSNSRSPVMPSPSATHFPRFDAVLVGHGEIESPAYCGIWEV